MKKQDKNAKYLFFIPCVFDKPNFAVAALANNTDLLVQI